MFLDSILQWPKTLVNVHLTILKRCPLYTIFRIFLLVFLCITPLGIMIIDLKTDLIVYCVLFRLILTDPLLIYGIGFLLRASNFTSLIFFCDDVVH